MKPEESFVRHQPCGDRIAFALILDRKKMRERIMVGEASQIFFGLNGNMDAELLCDVTHSLGTFKNWSRNIRCCHRNLWTGCISRVVL